MGQPPYPAVLFQMGHSLNGKAADPYQRCCQGLAKLGYVVLAFEPMGQGERTYYPKPGGTTTRLASADDEHSLPGRQMLLAGTTATRLQTWDAVRSLDVLAAHPLVDAKRIASTGNSGGGTLTMFLAAVDDRLAAAAVSCANTENFACAKFNSPGSVDDAEQNFLGAGPLGFDRWDTLYPFAPKPLLVTVSARDFFGTYSPSYLVSGEEEFAKLAAMYKLLGRGDSIQWYTSPLPHGLTPNMRVEIYNFFERWLRGSDRKVEEPPTKPEPEQQLYVGPTGNAVRDFGSKTPRELIQTPRPPNRLPFQVDDPPRARAAVLGQVRFGSVRIETAEVQSAPGVYIPMYVFTPEKPGGNVLLVLEPQGRNARWREDDLYHTLAKGGTTVCAFDVRGVGDLSPEVGRGNPYYTRPHSEEDAYAWASMMLGEPLLVQRVKDILAVAGSMLDRGKVKLAARGAMTVPALFASVQEERIGSVYLAGGLESYSSLVEREEYEHPLANFYPNVLSSTDLPLLRAKLGSRLKEGGAWTREALARV
jgi:hypothetical protein